MMARSPLGIINSILLSNLIHTAPFLAATRRGEDLQKKNCAKENGSGVFNVQFFRTGHWTHYIKQLVCVKRL